jgi:hypothetical protein
MRGSFSLSPRKDDYVARRRQVVGKCWAEFGCDSAGSNVMYLPFILTALPVAICAALVAWYYDRAFQNARYEYLGMTGQADDVYISIVRPLRTYRLIALCIATVASAIAISLIGLTHI